MRMMIYAFISPQMAQKWNHFMLKLIKPFVSGAVVKVSVQARWAKKKKD